jgi:hypothetical protein
MRRKSALGLIPEVDFEPYERHAFRTMLTTGIVAQGMLDFIHSDMVDSHHRAEMMDAAG